MAGRYPYVEPSRVSSREVGEAQIEAILGVGITRFVCLQAELPPQEALPVGGKDGFLPYRPTATLVAAALSGPPSLEIMDGLRNPHLDAFLPPRRKPDRHAGDAAHVAAAAERRRVEVSFGHCPIPDLGVPSVEAAEAVVADLCARLTAGERVYLHCWGGRGRAGTVGACVLGRLYGVSVDEALARVDAGLRTREPGGRSPEKEEQREFVRAFLGK
jgi:alanine transaminase